MNNQQQANTNTLLRGAQVRVSHAQSKETLAEAVQAGNTEIVKSLLDAGADPNTVDLDQDAQVLELACIEGYIEIVKSLLDKGACPNNGIFSSSLALTWAASQGFTEIAKMLLDKGAKYRNGKGYPLELASCWGHTEIVNMLLDDGADPNQSPTALEEAAYAGHTEIVKSLLNKGADPSKSPEAVNKAAAMGRTEIIQLLLDNGIKPSQLTKALELANYFDNTNTAKILQNAGAKLDTAPCLTDREKGLYRPCFGRAVTARKGGNRITPWESSYQLESSKPVIQQDRHAVNINTDTTKKPLKHESRQQSTSSLHVYTNNLMPM